MLSPQFQLFNMSQEITLTFKLTPYNNNSFIGEIIQTNGSRQHKLPDYDNEGAVYYVLAVILMYGCSILLMIGSSIKKTKHDNHINTYMKELEMMGQLQRKQDTFRTKLQMHQKKVIVFCV